MGIKKTLTSFLLSGAISLGLAGTINAEQISIKQDAYKIYSDDFSDGGMHDWFGAKPNTAYYDFSSYVVNNNGNLELQDNTTYQRCFAEKDNIQLPDNYQIDVKFLLSEPVNMFYVSSRPSPISAFCEFGFLNAYSKDYIFLMNGEDTIKKEIINIPINEWNTFSMVRTPEQLELYYNNILELSTVTVSLQPPDYFLSYANFSTGDNINYAWISNFDVWTVPEPSTLSLLVIGGLAGLGVYAIRRKEK
jgi:hypothetical protein